MDTTNNCPASTSFWDSITGAYERAKNSVSNVFSSNTNNTDSSNSNQLGGKRKKRKLRGGKIADNISQTNLASHSAKISGIQSAKPHQITRGGKRRKNKSKKSRKSKK